MYPPIQLLYANNNLKRKRNKEVEFDQSKDACMEISQWNPFVQLIYANKK
jgi:hypothetical protein